MQTREPLVNFTYPNGFDTSRQPLDPRLVGCLGEGSQNIMCIDNGRNVPYGGFTTKGANTGSRILTTIGNTWGGIKDVTISNKTFVDGNVSVSLDQITITAHGYTTGYSFTLTTTGVLPSGLALATTYYVIKIDDNTIQVASSLVNALAGTAVNITSNAGGGTHTVNVSSVTVTATGSVYEDIGRSIWGIGSGQPHKEGTNFSLLQLSSLLQILLAVNGSYTSGTSGAFVAGLGRPSTVTVAVLDTIGAGYSGLIDGAVSLKIARVRLSTGARSVASPTSAVVVPVNKTVRLTFPSAATGQTHWHLFATQQGFGGVGISYQVAYGGVLDIAETTIAASTLNGLARTIEFEYRDGDLQPTEAYVDDYPPPAGTHAARVETSMVVFGCYSDSAAAPSGASTGTCAAVSLPNFPESYKPRHLLYFPEPVVTVLSRSIDSYCYVMCRNSIHAVQFVGFRGDLPSCTITTVSPDVGVQYPHNVCQAYGRIFLWAEKAGIVGMNSDGSLDYEFGAPIRKYTKSWDTSTVVSFDPSMRGITIANGGVQFVYCFQTGIWSSPIFLSDYSVTGSVEAAVTTRGEQVLSVNNAGSHTAYSGNLGGTSAPVIFASTWAECGTKRGKNIYEMILSGEFPTAGTVFTGLHSNFRKRVMRDATVTATSDTVGSVSAQLTAADVGREAFVFGSGIGSRTFVAGDVSTVNNTITITGHTLFTGQLITLTTSGTLPAPLTVLTNYYVIVVDADTIKLATTFENAYLGTVIDLTTAGTGTQTVPLNYLWGKMLAKTDVAFEITTLSGAALASQITASGLTLIIADQTFCGTVNGNGAQDVFSWYPENIEKRQVSVTTYFTTDTQTGEIFGNELFGDFSGISEINI